MGKYSTLAPVKIDGDALVIAAWGLTPAAWAVLSNTDRAYYRWNVARVIPTLANAR